MNRIKLGITGGIGSGKSVVSRLLEVMGIPVYQTDDAAKRLMSDDLRIRAELTALLGDGAYQDDGLNKPLLASYIFGHPDHARQVNGIVHPRVRQDFRQWAQTQAQGGHSLVGMESALIYEAGFQTEVDAVVMVYAPREVRIARAMRRDGASREAVKQRVDSQLDDEEKRLRADFVLVNDDETPLIPQVLDLISSLSRNH